MNIIISKELASKVYINFTPVEVTGGRKFKGFAYDLHRYYERSYGYAGSGVFPLTTTTSATLWDPVSCSKVYANEKFVNEVKRDSDIVLSDKAEYIRKIIQDTVDWCLSNGTDEKSSIQSARNILMKKHPYLRDVIPEVIPDTRNIFDEVKKTLTWAMGLKTKPTYLYGRHCPGGKDLPTKKKVNIALMALKNKGIATDTDEFKAAWAFNATLLGLTKYIEV